MLSVKNWYVALLLLLSFGFIFSFSVRSGIRIYPFDLLVVPIAAWGFGQVWNLRKKIWNNAKFLLLFLSTGLLGLLLFPLSTSDLISSSAYLIRLVLYLLLFLPLFQMKEKDLKKILKALSISGCVFLLLGYFQYFFYSDLANLYYLGWDRHLYRFFSTFFDPNFTGVYLTILLFITIGTVPVLFSNRPKILVILCLFLYIPAIFLTYSRSAYIAAFISGFIFLSFFSKKYTLFIIGLFLIGIIFLPKNSGGEGVNLLRTTSIYQRFESVENGLVIFLKNPILGTGFNSYKYASIHEGIITEENAKRSHAASGVSSSYVFTLATTGVIGFICIVVFIKQSLRRILKIKKESKYYLLSRAVACSIICVLVQSFFENSLFFAPILIFLIISYGVVIKLVDLED